MSKQLLTVIILISGMVFSTWENQSVASSRLAKASKQPTFHIVTPPNVQKSTQIVSSRSTAAFGFNAPLVRIYLPRIDNSTYAVIEFDEPMLLNDNGKSIACEIERGGYNIDLYSDEIRFAAPDGMETLSYAKAKGTGRILYPLKITTRAVHSGQPASNPEVIINGSRVTYIDQNISEMVFKQSHMGPVRAYDATGRQLIMGDYNASQTQGKIMRRTLSFLGKIAKVEIDTVAEWAEMAFSYKLPPTKPLPESYRGYVVSRPPQISATRDGDVSVRFVSQGTSAPVKNE